MQIRQEIVARHWRDAAIEETAATYAAQGYEVSQHTPIGAGHADLVARKGDELVVLEFKLGQWSDEDYQAVRQLRRDVIHRLGGKFHLVVVTPPNEKHIEIDGIQTILATILQSHPTALGHLSTHAHAIGVSDVTIASVSVEQRQFCVEGIGTVEVQLSQGTQTNGGSVGSTVERFPFDFVLILDGDLHVLEVKTLNVDLSSYEV